MRNITNEKYNRLTALEYLGNYKWLCECECVAKTKIPVNYYKLISGHTKSCGCLNTERIGQMGRANKRHGKSHTKEHKTWSAMFQRCYNTNNKYYKDYGGRGIIVCERWHTFENFFADMGECPSDKDSIDRIDNDGIYYKENCRWATQIEQCNNRRPRKYVTYNGRQRSLASLAKEHGLDYHTVQTRVDRHWTLERALKTPVRARKVSKQG
jgi:hypothetical protein